MDRFEMMRRLSQEFGSYIHINFRNPDEIFTEDDYQELKEYFLNLSKEIKKKKENENESA
ncbi:MAG: hypothetical protein ACLTW7_09300 [Enterococcus sp.]|uniref:hypothetical protein n=1 Tax=Enterococcus sp. TaxID=35783 RepID=UPI0039929B89